MNLESENDSVMMRQEEFEIDQIREMAIWYTDKPNPIDLHHECAVTYGSPNIHSSSRV